MRTPFAPPPAADPHAAAAEAWQMIAGLVQAAQLIPQVQRAAPGSLPLTVIGGFLGAGKTTLLNRLLTAPHGRRIAALVNDFGRIDIDAALIRARTADTISLANGCACCSVAGDLTKTLVELARRTDPPDAIVLEASGLADPRGIAQVALANPALRLDGILALVDAEAAPALAADPACARTFAAQLTAADLIVLNKTDLVDASTRARLHSWLAETSGGRPVLDALNGDVPPTVVLGIASERNFSAETSMPVDHASGFQSWGVETARALDAKRVRELLAAMPSCVLRAKGMLWIADDRANRNIFQRVGARWSLAPGEPWGTEPPRSSLVMIARAGAARPQAVLEGFAACAAD